ncbi:XAC0095 family protein [Luteimonas saliphila]|uniref:XAC0095 family protein n=1 Tax=Luteimonas saliphila TaxID=2804919 RepID=UPI00192E2BFC|nr:hypothetical protein [Luteimonas saliphila]
MSKHDDETGGTGGTGYFLPEDSEFRLRKLRNHMAFLSQLAQPRSDEEEHGGGPEIEPADLEVCLELLAEQVQRVLDEVAWPAKVVQAGATVRASHASGAMDAETADAADEDADGDDDDVPEGPDADSVRYAFGMTGDQFDTLDRLVQTISAHGDMVANGDAAALASDTVPLVGQAIFDGMEAVRALLDAVEAQALGQPRGRTGIGEEQAVYGPRIRRPMFPRPAGSTRHPESRALH